MARRKTVTRLIEGHEVPFLSLAGLCGELRALLAAEDGGDEDGERRAAVYGNALFFCLLLAESGECMAGAWDFWGDTLAQIENQS